MKLSIPQQQSKSEYFPWSELWKADYWRTFFNVCQQQTQNWLQPITNWSVLSKQETSLWIKAQEDENYQRQQDWRKHFKQQAKQLFQAIVKRYRQGFITSPEQLLDALLAQQAAFDNTIISPVYYTRILMRLAQRLPRYAHTFEGVAAHFRDYLKAHPEEALNYFYNDAVYQLVSDSRDASFFSISATTASQRELLNYYQDLIPSEVYHSVVEVFVTVAQAQPASDATLTSSKKYEQALRQLKALFQLTSQERATAGAFVSFANSDVLERLTQTLADGWSYFKENPKTILLSAMGAALGASVIYELGANGKPTGWFADIQPLAYLPPAMVYFSPLPLAISHLNWASMQPYATKPLVWQYMTSLALANFIYAIPTVAAQSGMPKRWVKALNGARHDYGLSVQQTQDGGYIVAGATEVFRFNRYDSDLLLSKWAANGTLAWAKKLGGSLTDEGSSVQQMTDGGFIVTGYTESFSGTGSTDLWLSKWTPDGELAWVKTLGRNSGQDRGHAVQQTTDGGFIVLGTTTSLTSIAGNCNAALWLTKWTKDGELAWGRTLGGVNLPPVQQWLKNWCFEDEGYSLQQTADGGYITVGTGGFVIFGENEHDTRLLLAKWTANGELAWAKTLGKLNTANRYDSKGNFVRQTSDGGYIVTGSTNKVGFPDLDDDLWLLKWTANGVLSWAKTLGGNGFDIGHSVLETPEGDYLTVGATSSFSIYYHSDLWLSKWSNDGNLIWSKTLEGPNMENGYSLQRTTDGSYIIAGSTSSLYTGGDDLLLSKWNTLDNGNCISQKDMQSINIPLNDLNLTTVTATSENFNILPQTLTVFAENADFLQITMCKDNPQLGNHQLTIVEGQTLILTTSHLSATDFDNHEGSLLFTVSNIKQGRFEFAATPGVPITQFTQQQVWDGAVRFVHDGSELAPGFDVSVSDGEFATSPEAATIYFIPVNDLTTLSPTQGNATYIENSPPQSLAPDLVLSDPDSVNLVEASVTITQNYRSAEDRLRFTNQFNIFGSYDTATGTLLLEGIASLSNYQTALRNVRYENLADNPNSQPRTLSIRVYDSAYDQSAPAWRTVSIVPINDPPVLSGVNSATLTYNEGGSPVVLMDSLTITDVDSPSLQSAAVIVTGNFRESEDRLDFTSQPGISGTYNASSGTLALMGPASLTNYQTLLRSLTYRNLAAMPTSTIRTITVSVHDGQSQSLPAERLVGVVTRNKAPVLLKNKFELTEGGALVLTPAQLLATPAVGVPAEQITLYISNLKYADFELTTQPGTSISSFTQQQINAGAVRLITDGGENKPSFTIRVSDGIEWSTPVEAAVDFTNVNDAPVVDNPMPDQTVKLNEPFSFAIPKDTFFDPDTGDSLSYHAQMLDGQALPSWISLDAPNRKFTGQTSNPGKTRFSLFAFDKTNASARTDFNVIAGSANNDTQGQDNLLLKALPSSGGAFTILVTIIGFLYRRYNRRQAHSRLQHDFADLLRLLLKLPDVSNFKLPPGEMYVKIIEEDLLKALHDTRARLAGSNIVVPGFNLTKQEKLSSSEIALLAAVLVEAIREQTTTATNCWGQSLIKPAQIQANAETIAEQAWKSLYAFPYIPQDVDSMNSLPPQYGKYKKYYELSLKILCKLKQHYANNTVMLFANDAVELVEIAKEAGEILTDTNLDQSASNALPYRFGP